MALAPTSFVNLSFLSINTFYPLIDKEGSVEYKILPGLSKLDYIEKDLAEAIYTQAKVEIDSLRKLQFELVYYLKLTKADVDKLSYLSLLKWYELLVEKKEKEAQQSNIN